RRDALRGPRPEGAGAADRGGAAVPGTLAAGRSRTAGPRAARPRVAAHSLGAARGGRAGAGAREPRARAGRSPHAAGTAARPRGRARRPVGAGRAVRRRARVETRVTRLSLEHVSFWYPATDTPALADVSLDVAGGEVVALVGAVGAGASTLLLVAADLLILWLRERRPDLVGLQELKMT